MQYREVSFTFPDNATDRDKIIMVLQSPYSFVRWCRTQVGVAPNTIRRVDDCCVLEQYLLDVSGVECGVASDCVMPMALRERSIITPTWVHYVIKYVDIEALKPTYNDVGNMLLSLLERGVIA